MPYPGSRLKAMRPRECEFKECEEPTWRGPYCHRHYLQWQKRQKNPALGPMVLGFHGRPNRVEISGANAEVFCRNRRGEEVGSFLVDKEDWPKIATYRWRIAPDGYVKGTLPANLRPPKNILLHRLILGVHSEPAPSGSGALPVDHITGNKLDNRRANLRLVTTQENVWNRDLYPGGRRLGVVHRARHKERQWCARMTHLDKRLWASFATYEEAVAAREEWERMRADGRL